LPDRPEVFLPSLAGRLAEEARSDQQIRAGPRCSWTHADPIRGQHVAEAWKDCSLRTETGCCLPSRPEIVQEPAKIDHPKTASGHKSSFSLTRQAQTNRYDRRIDRRTHESDPGPNRTAASDHGSELETENSTSYELVLVRSRTTSSYTKVTRPRAASRPPPPGRCAQVVP
jgi:hypothetical protein